jgi:hypothetical protein
LGGSAILETETMNENDPKGMRKEEGGPRAGHGYRNEVSWEGGSGRQPYTNQEEELPPAAAGEFEGGNAGDVAGRNVEQLEEVKRKPEEGNREAPRDTGR